VIIGDGAIADRDRCFTDANRIRLSRARLRTGHALYES
jgi:hypothetical protein